MRIIGGCFCERGIKQVDTYIHMHQEMDHKMATPVS